MEVPSLLRTSWASSPEYFSKWPVTNYIRVTPSLMAHRDCDVSGQSQHNWLSINILWKSVIASEYWSEVLSSSAEASSDRWKECSLQKSDVCRGSHTSWCYHICDLKNMKFHVPLSGHKWFQNVLLCSSRTLRLWQSWSLCESYDHYCNTTVNCLTLLWISHFTLCTILLQGFCSVTDWVKLDVVNVLFHCYFRVGLARFINNVVTWGG